MASATDPAALNGGLGWADDDPATAALLPIAEAVALYLAHKRRRGLRPQTIRQTDMVLRAFRRWRGDDSPAAAITLREVYRAIEDEPLFALHHRAPSTACPVGRHIQQVLTPCFDAARRTLEADLARTSIADILTNVLAPLDAPAGSPRPAESSP